MKYLDLRAKIPGNVFTFLDVAKLFSVEPESAITIQLFRFAKKRLIQKIKRGLYCFDPHSIDELELASLLYQPSYISLETALNYYGMIPDIPAGVTSVTTTTTKNITTSFGQFYYTKVKVPLFFGFRKVQGSFQGFFNLAEKEKALLDYIYVRKIHSFSDLRLNVKGLDNAQYKKFANQYPEWVQNITL